MKCTYCGAELKEGDAFCGECGKPVPRKAVEKQPLAGKEGFFNRPVPEEKFMTYFISGIICVPVSIFFLPPGFGGVAIALGYVLWKNGPEEKRDYGKGLFLAGILGMVIGLIIWIVAALMVALM